jgi:hypothetical protein
MGWVKHLQNFNINQRKLDRFSVVSPPVHLHMNQIKYSHISTFCRSLFYCCDATSSCLDTVKDRVYARLIIKGNIKFYYIFEVTSNVTAKAEGKYFLSPNSSFERQGTEAIPFSEWYNGSDASMALLYRKPLRLFS